MPEKKTEEYQINWTNIMSDSLKGFGYEAFYRGDVVRKNRSKRGYVDVGYNESDEKSPLLVVQFTGYMESVFLPNAPLIENETAKLKGEELETRRRDPMPKNYFLASNRETKSESKLVFIPENIGKMIDTFPTPAGRKLLLNLANYLI